MSERGYCSEMTRAAAEPLFGTAEQVHVWVLIEYRGPFRPRALEDNMLSAAVKAWIDAAPAAIEAASGDYARMQFISRPHDAHGGPAAAGIKLLVARVDGGGGQLFEAGLADHEALLLLDPVALARGAAPLVARDEPLYLVCTNGQRDVCCARFGLPVFEHLSARLGAHVWQTTHVGGHRYAPNLVCLPSGAVYGFATTDVVDGLVDADRAGNLALAHLRGRSCHATDAQVAEQVLREHLRLPAFGALVYAGSEEVGARRFRVAFVDGANARHVAEVWHDEQPVIVQASCGDGGRKPIERWHGAAL